MRTVAALCAAFFIYHQILLVAGNDHNDGKDSRQLKRTAREAPAAVDCKMTQWSTWSPCDPCTKRMYRSRSVEAFGQFKGLMCNQPLGDRRACRPNRACEEQIRPQCASTEFQCESGICIKKRLVCNGDNDCGDFFDEDDCEEVKRTPCGKRDPQLSELGRTAGYGVNILGADPRSNAFNNEFFNGLCSQVRDTNTLEYHRIPWNVASLNYVTLAEESFSKEFYQDSSALLKEVLQETKHSISWDFSFKFVATEELTNISLKSNVQLKFENKRSENIKALSEYSTEKVSRFFMRVKGKVQLSTFRMRSRELMLTETFLDDVANLPVEYLKGEYFRFLEEYGTHYAISGQSGGEYELVYIMNKETMSSKQITEQKIYNCLNLGASINFGVSNGNQGDLNIKNENCEDIKTKGNVTEHKNVLIDKVVTFVSGGTVATAAALQKKIEKSGKLDVDAYVQWAKSLAHAPVLLHSQLESIYSLIPLNIPDASAKKENLERATQDYIAEYSVCKCQPCQNGGTVTLVDGQCLCLCAPQFEGLACQVVKSDLLRGVNIVQEGNWNCWTPWKDKSIMEFSDEEKKWLAKIASEVPEKSELTSHEQHLYSLAKPKDLLEEWIFEFMACVKFGIFKDSLTSGAYEGTRNLDMTTQQSAVSV
ncbi:complement component C9 [Arapaima gigas]